MPLPPYEVLVRYECTHRPKMLVSNGVTGEAFIPECGSYVCEACGRRKAKNLAEAISRVFEGKRIRLATFTTTNRFNPGLSRPLPVLAWRIFLKNLRNYRVFSQFATLQFVRITEFQENGNPHFHCLFDKFVPVKLLDLLWRDAVVSALSDEGHTVGSQQKISNVNLVGDIRDSKAVFRYVLKYVTKGVATFRVHRKAGERYRPYSSTRGIRLFDARQVKPGWKATRFDELWRSGLYLSSVGLLPKDVDGVLKVCLCDELYSVIHGVDFVPI